MKYRRIKVLTNYSPGLGRKMVELPIYIKVKTSLLVMQTYLSS